MLYFSILCLLGLACNAICIVVLHNDRDRREALFLMQMLAIADIFYLLISLLRYPLKYIISDQEIYIKMQVVFLFLLFNMSDVTIRKKSQYHVNF